MVKTIDNELFDQLTKQAKISARLRMNLDLRNSPNDQSQRMLNALEPETIIPIHRHRFSSETVVVLRGKVKWIYYDNDGKVTDTFVVEPQGEICGLNVPIGQWHSLECLESGTVILETKDGAYAPMEEVDLLYLISEN